MTNFPALRQSCLAAMARRLGGQVFRAAPLTCGFRSVRSGHARSGLAAGQAFASVPAPSSLASQGLVHVTGHLEVGAFAEEGIEGLIHGGARLDEHREGDVDARIAIGRLGRIGDGVQQGGDVHVGLRVSALSMYLLYGRKVAMSTDFDEKVLGHLSCEQLHHGSKDRHALGEPCPVEARHRSQQGSAMRRIVRVNRLLAECGHTDVIEALMDLKRIRERQQPQFESEEEPPTCGKHGDF